MEAYKSNWGSLKDETLSKALALPICFKIQQASCVCSKHADLGVGQLFVFCFCLFQSRGWVAQGTLWHHDAFALRAVHVL